MGSLCLPSPWPFTLEVGMAVWPPEKEYVSASFHKVQDSVGSFL